MKEKKGIPIGLYLLGLYLIPSFYSAAWFVKDFFSSHKLSFEGWSEPMVCIGMPGALVIGIIALMTVTRCIIYLLEYKV